MRKAPSGPCAVADCPTSKYGHKAWCLKHYSRVRRHGDPHATKYIVQGGRRLPGPDRTDDEKRALLQQRSAPAPNGCRLWTGPVSPRSGYGLWKYRRGRSTQAHRVAYEVFIGPIPAGLVVDHDCHNRSTDCHAGPCDHRRCIEPSHLMVRGRGENPCASPYYKSNWTHCPQGHAYDNYRRPNGRRRCLVCLNAKQRERKADRRLHAVG